MTYGNEEIFIRLLVQNFQPAIVRRDFDDLKAECHASFYRHKKYRGESFGEPARLNLFSVMVTAIRHNETNYDAVSTRLWSVGATKEILLEIRSRALNAIANAYPELASECERQKKLKYDPSDFCPIGNAKKRPRLTVALKNEESVG